MNDVVEVKVIEVLRVEVNLGTIECLTTTESFFLSDSSELSSVETRILVEAVSSSSEVCRSVRVGVSLTSQSRVLKRERKTHNLRNLPNSRFLLLLLRSNLLLHSRTNVSSNRNRKSRHRQSPNHRGRGRRGHQVVDAVSSRLESVRRRSIVVRCQ